MSPCGFFFLGNCLRPPKTRVRTPSPWIPSPTLQSPPQALFRLFLSAPTLPPKCPTPVQSALILACSQPLHFLVVTPNAILPTFPCRQVMITLQSHPSFFQDIIRLSLDFFRFWIPKVLIKNTSHWCIGFSPNWCE